MTFKYLVIKDLSIKQRIEMESCIFVFLFYKKEKTTFVPLF